MFVYMSAVIERRISNRRASWGEIFQTVDNRELSFFVLVLKRTGFKFMLPMEVFILHFVVLVLKRTG